MWRVGQNVQYPSRGSFFPRTIFKAARYFSSLQHNIGSILIQSASNSQQLGKPSFNSRLVKKILVPLLLLMGLIISRPLGSSGDGVIRRVSGQLEPSNVVYGADVTSIGEEVKFGIRVPKVKMWVFAIVVLMATVVGVFMMATMKNVRILVVVGGVLVPVVVVVWNRFWGKRETLGYLSTYLDVELQGY